MKNMYTLWEEILREHQRTNDLLEVRLPKPVKEVKILPEFIDTTWACSELHIGRTTFYAWVRGRLLHPVDRQGKSDYYNAEEVRRLYQRHRQERLPYRYMQPEEAKGAA
ncbi:hypothetical protein [Parapedobacter soli]|uniref:hypothetical protein n=1 Tax=Parapedobacter soli TaxID=416955 RepID=UPI0021CA8225|nr:hypothetical protein [Parapedobacter soli]